MTKPLCIYHSIDGIQHCDDGFGAAWAVWKAHGDTFDYYPGVYQIPPPEVKDREVVLVDFSYKIPIIQAMAETAKSILILDHHKTAKDDLEPLSRYKKYRNVSLCFDLRRSGARIAWEHYHLETPIPSLLAHIEDRDLHRFDLPGTMEISMALRAYPQTFEQWDELMACPLDDLYHDGSAIYGWFKKQVGVLRQAAMTQTIGGHTVPVVNAPIMFASDVASILAETHLFAACYWDSPMGRVYSLRSHKNGMDVSEIAKLYGGGGHRHAAGFKLEPGKAL